MRHTRGARRRTSAARQILTVAAERAAPTVAASAEAATAAEAVVMAAVVMAADLPAAFGAGVACPR
jgi:hypothetical protein